MGSSRAEKAASHERIVRTAAARMRRDGIDGVSVAELMSDAGLTHGGFYRHFRSREELVAEAVERALADGAERTTAAAGGGGSTALHRIIDGYLSPTHRDEPESGCAVAGLPAEIARSNARARAAYAGQVTSYVELLAGLIAQSDRPAERDDAFLVLSALVGALSMARAVDDPRFSDEILDETARALRRLVHV